MNTKFSLERLKQLQKSINVFSVKPSSYDIFDESVPQELIDAYQLFIEQRDYLNELLEKYDIEKLS